MRLSRLRNDMLLLLAVTLLVVMLVGWQAAIILRHMARKTYRKQKQPGAPESLTRLRG